MSNILQKTKAEFGLGIIIIILSGASASFVIFGPLDIMPGKIAFKSDPKR